MNPLWRMEIRQLICTASIVVGAGLTLVAFLLLLGAVRAVVS
jgi:hypothetical protein